MAAAPRVVGGFKAEEDPDEEVKAMTTAVRAGGGSVPAWPCREQVGRVGNCRAHPTLTRRAVVLCRGRAAYYEHALLLSGCSWCGHELLVLALLLVALLPRAWRFRALTRVHVSS